MQASPATKVEPDAVAVPELALDLHAVLGFLLNASTPDVLDALAELDLSLTHMKLLHLLEQGERESVKDLGEAVGLSLPAASRAVDCLFQRGLVERREDEHDRRVKRVRPTPAGREAVRRLNDARLTALEQFISTLSAADQRRLDRALKPILARAEVAQHRPERTR